LPNADGSDEFEDHPSSVLAEVIAVTQAAVVRYHTTTVSTERNRELIEDVLAELAARDPGGLRYQVFRFDDGVGFVHVAVFDGTTDPFAECTAYREFHRELRDRLAAPPTVIRAVLIGSYPRRHPEPKGRPKLPGSGCRR
jgi:hypothetical protein